MKNELAALIWWPHGTPSGLEDAKSTISKNVSDLRAWAKSREYRDVLLQEANALFADAREGRPMGPMRVDVEHADEVLAILAFVILENYGKPESSAAFEYVIQRWNNPELLERQDGMRYLGASLAVMASEDLSQVTLSQVFLVLDHSDHYLRDALIEEWGSTASAGIEELIRVYLARPGAKHAPYLEWVPVRIEYGRSQTPEEKVSVLKHQLARAHPERVKVTDLDGLYWVLDQIRTMNARELIPELQNLDALLDQSDKSAWILSRRIAEVLKYLTNE